MASICSGMGPESRKDHILQNTEMFMKTHKEEKSWEARKWPFAGVEDSAFVLDTKHSFWKLSLCIGKGLFVDAFPVQGKRKISHGATTPTPTPQCSFHNNPELMCAMRERSLAIASYTASRDAGGERSPMEILESLVSCDHSSFFAIWPTLSRNISQSFLVYKMVFITCPYQMKYVEKHLKLQGAY